VSKDLIIHTGVGNAVSYHGVGRSHVDGSRRIPRRPGYGVAIGSAPDTTLYARAVRVWCARRAECPLSVLDGARTP
jgi:hypothetical protein